MLFRGRRHCLFNLWKIIAKLIKTDFRIEKSSIEKWW